jgi:SET domain-containing protein
MVAASPLVGFVLLLSMIAGGWAASFEPRASSKPDAPQLVARSSKLIRRRQRQTIPDKIDQRPMTLILRQSRIHSYGCYTTRPIRKGRLIVEYVGEYLTYEQADDLYDDFENTYLFGLDGGKRIIDGYGVAAFVNHSCKPNCETDQIRGKMWIIALRDIAAGEELTYDYNLYDGEDDAPCLCGAARCRGSLYSATHLRKLAKKRTKAVAAAAS